MAKVKGSDLSAATQRDALARFVHRFTRDHVPDWAKRPRPDGRPYKVQFASDRDWLENTHFHVNADGRLSRAHSYCDSRATWPEGKD